MVAHGFVKKGLRFYKTTEDLIYMFHVQKSRGNSANELMFYMNCGIYAPEIASIQQKSPLALPDEADCHFRARLEEISTSMPGRFAIHADTDRQAFTELLIQGLTDAIAFYGEMTTTRSILDYYITGPYLHLSEESLHFLLQANEGTAAQAFVTALHKQYGEETRWQIWARKYQAIFAQYHTEMDVPV